jgi:hypothetical protein
VPPQRAVAAPLAAERQDLRRTSGGLAGALAMTLQRPKTKNISAAECLEALIDGYTPTVASIARGALARLRKQVPGAFELVGDRYTGLVVGFSPTERPADATLSIVLYPRWVNLFFLRGAILHDPRRLLQGAGTVVRHIAIHDPALLDDRAVQALVAQARAQARTSFRRRRRIIIKSISAKRRSRRPTRAK